MFERPITCNSSRSSSQPPPTAVCRCTGSRHAPAAPSRAAKTHPPPAELAISRLIIKLNSFKLYTDRWPRTSSVHILLSPIRSGRPFSRTLRPTERRQVAEIPPEFAADRVIRSAPTQKSTCRAFQGPSIGACLLGMEPTASHVLA